MHAAWYRNRAAMLVEQIERGMDMNDQENFDRLQAYDLAEIRRSSRISDSRMENFRLGIGYPDTLELQAMALEILMHRREQRAEREAAKTLDLSNLFDPQDGE